MVASLLYDFCHFVLAAIDGGVRRSVVVVPRIDVFCVRTQDGSFGYASVYSRRYHHDQRRVLARNILPPSLADQAWFESSKILNWNFLEKQSVTWVRRFLQIGVAKSDWSSRTHLFDNIEIYAIITKDVLGMKWGMGLIACRNGFLK